MPSFTVVGLKSSILGLKLSLLPFGCIKKDIAVAANAIAKPIATTPVAMGYYPIFSK